MELPQRKNIRLKGYDYSQNGYYFVTICTQNRSHLFGKVVGAIHESPEISPMKLNTNGMIVKSVIGNLSNGFSDIHIAHYVIMPNHLHMIVVIFGDRAIRESPLPKRSSLSKLIGYLKMNTMKQIHALNKNKNVWQRGYYDHIIRNEAEYQKIWEYIDTNPLKWEFDMYYGDHEQR